MSISNKANSLSSKIFIGTVLLAIVSTLFYYSRIYVSLVGLPFVLSPIEGLNAWIAGSLVNKQFDNSVFNQAPLWNSFSEGMIYPWLLSKLFSLNGHIQDLPAALKESRNINLFALVFCLFSYFVLLKKEKISLIICLMSSLVFLCLPISQIFFYEARPELFGLGFGLLGLYLTSNKAKGSSLIQVILSSFCLALAFGFTMKLSFLSFGLVSFLMTLTAKNHSDLKRQLVLLPLFAFTFFGLSLFMTGLNRLNIWDLNLFWSNLLIFKNWPLLTFAACLIFMKDKIDFSGVFSFKSAAFILFISALVITLWESGNKVTDYSGWLVVSLATCWLIAVIANQLFVIEDEIALGFFSLFTLGLIVFTPLLLPQPMKVLAENPNLKTQSTNWLLENKKLQTKKQRKDKKPKLLSQDLGLSIACKQLPLMSDPNISFSDEALMDINSRIQTQKFNNIILTSQPEKIWSKALIKAVKQFYYPTNEILVLGEKGFIYKPKELETQNNLDDTYSSKEEMFATFHRI